MAPFLATVVTALGVSSHPKSVVALGPLRLSERVPVCPSVPCVRNALP